MRRELHCRNDKSRWNRAKTDLIRAETGLYRWCWRSDLSFAKTLRAHSSPYRRLRPIREINAVFWLTASRLLFAAKLPRRRIPPRNREKIREFQFCLRAVFHSPAPEFAPDKIWTRHQPAFWQLCRVFIPKTAKHGAAFRFSRRPTRLPYFRFAKPRAVNASRCWFEIRFPSP